MKQDKYFNKENFAETHEYEWFAAKQHAMMCSFLFARQNSYNFEIA